MATLKKGTKVRIVNATGAKAGFNGATATVTGKGRTFFERTGYALDIDWGGYVWFDGELEVMQ